MISYRRQIEECHQMPGCAEEKCVSDCMEKFVKIQILEHFCKIFCSSGTGVG